MLRDTGFKLVRTETTGRIFTLKGWLEMLQVMHPIFGVLKPLGNTFLGRIKFTFNPGYKTTVYAVKV